DLNPDGHFGLGTQPVEWQGSLLFQGGAAKRGRIPSDGDLWASAADGSPERVFDDPPVDEATIRDLAVDGDRFYFSAQPAGVPSGSATDEVWVSDGTDAGTERLTVDDGSGERADARALAVVDGTL